MRVFIIVFLALFIYNGVTAQNSFIPEPTGKVISDFENLMTPEEQEELAADIKKSYNASSNQLMVVCIPTGFVGNLRIEDYAQQLFNKWQPGQKDLNNGVLLIVTGSKTDNVGRKIRIQVGYGLEGALPDLICKHIQMQLMVPLLKEDRYAEALRAGSLAILGAMKNENVGRQIKYKSYPKESIVLTDQLGVLSAAEYKSFESRLKVFYSDGMNPSTIQESSSELTDVVYTDYSTNYIFDLSVNHNLQFTSDSSGTSGLTKGQTYYYLAMNNATGYSEKEMEDNRLRVKAFLEKDDMVGAINVISIKEKAMSAGWAEIRMLIYIQLALLLITIIFRMLHVRKVWTAANVKGFRKFIAGMVTIPTLIICLLGMVALILAHIAIYSAEYCLPTLWLVVICVAQEIICLITFIINIDNLITFFPGTGKSGGSGYHSSYSSSNIYSSYSSDSSYSGSDSSSNSDYGGGGGSSGGGGATSDW